MEKRFSYFYKNTEYPVIVTYKRMKNIRYRFKDDKILVSSPFFVALSYLKNGVEKYAPKLIEKCRKIPPLGENYIYIFGEIIPIQDKGEITFTNGDILSYKSKGDLIDRLTDVYKKYLVSKQAYFEKIMGIESPYKLKIKEVKTIYGSNSFRRHEITYSSILMHYSFDVIDSIIVHELAHHFIRNHSNKFYETVLKYCPNYYIYNKMLKRGQFK